VYKYIFRISIPWLFIFNTFILAGSSICIEKCRKNFALKNERLTLRWGVMTIAMTLLFLVLQGLAWYQLFNQQIAPGTSGGYGYLYAISILHFLHVSAGIPFLLRLMIPLAVSSRQGSGVLYFMNNHYQRKLRHTVWYWHFIDAVWIYLMIFFLASRMF
jgi:cytochrome c oxidase subunit 3